jgi:hypothetical protein
MDWPRNIFTTSILLILLSVAMFFGFLSVVLLAARKTPGALTWVSSITGNQRKEDGTLLPTRECVTTKP